MLDLKWNNEKNRLHIKEAPAQPFFSELSEIPQNSFFKEHVWTADSNLGKYLKTLAIVIAFSENIWLFGICENRV